MSIYFDFKVGPKGRRFRRAVEADKYDIELIWNREHTEPLFQDVNIGSLIELSALSIVMINDSKDVVGFMSLSDYPNIPSVDPADWETWIRNLYQRYYLSRNTLFIHFMCCIDEVTDFFIEEAFISVFLNDSYLQYIVLTVNMFCPEELLTRFLTFKKRNIMKYIPKGFEGVGNYLYTALRMDFCPKLKMRRAVEEDNDDIVNILNDTCPRLKELYGEFYISEIIGRHPESDRKIIVADVQGRAVAVMCLNTDINYKKLQTMYELWPFHGLKSATALEKEQNKRADKLLADFGDPIMLGKWSPFDQHFEEKDLRPRKPRDNERQDHAELRGPLKKSSRVNFVRPGAGLDQILIKSHSDDFSDIVPSRTISRHSVVNLLDEDPFDYEILNIDTTLLNVDDMSHELLTGPLLEGSFIENTMFEQQKVQQKSSLNFTKILRNKRAEAKKYVTIEEKESRIYHGRNNAFMIELFAFRDDIDERNAYDLLEAAFELTKDYDYCIIRVPSADNSFPLLQHFCFVPTKPKVCCKYSLYVAHRSSVLGKLRVREAEIIDIPQITRLMTSIDGTDTLVTIEKMLNKPENLAYVFTSGMHVVGLALLEGPEQLNFLRAKFNLDSYQIHNYHYIGHGIEAGFATVKCVLAYPAFEPHYRFFSRELMRLSRHSTLLWMTAYRNKWTIQKANSIVASMIPLMPRPIEIDHAAVPELRKISMLIEKLMAFSCWFIGRKLTTLSKVDINTRIVVVGASRTCLGFLNALLFCQTSTYLTFNNVTLVSPNGLPYIKHSKSAAELMFLRYYTSTDKYLKSVPYTYYVNVVQGTLMELDLHEKFITLTSGSRYYYDLLFLFFGKQYQHPDHMMHLLQRDREYKDKKSPPKYTRLDIPRHSDTEIQIANDETPENVFIVNNVAEAERALNYVKKFINEENMKVIVYGATIHAYLCINALLEIKVHPENIIFIEPFPPEEPTKTRVPVFCNVNVDQTVKQILDKLKIKVYQSYYFKSWSVTMDNIITHADFLSYANYLRLDCTALFYYGRIGVNMRAFIAIHKSGLAYDGGIVIDHECRTLDPYVYAAGPCTRYHKRYYADAQSHKYFDSYELGEKASLMLFRL